MWFCQIIGIWQQNSWNVNPESVGVKYGTNLSIQAEAMPGKYIQGIVKEGKPIKKSLTKKFILDKFF